MPLRPLWLIWDKWRSLLKTGASLPKLASQTFLGGQFLRPGNSAFHDLSGEGAQAHVRQLILLLLLVTQMALAGLTHRMATMEKK